MIFVYMIVHALYKINVYPTLVELYLTISYRVSDILESTVKAISGVLYNFTILLYLRFKDKMSAERISIVLIRDKPQFVSQMHQGWSLLPEN